MNPTPRVYKFEEWCQQYGIELPKLVECEECDGTGICNECGCGNDHDCGYCEGTGESLDGNDERNQIIQEYETQAKKDKENWEKAHKAVR